MAETTVLLHLDKIERTVDSAGNLGNIDIEGELLVKEMEHLVFAVAVHEVNTSADISVIALGKKFDTKLVAARGDAVDGRIVSTLHGAVLGASLAISANGGVPGSASVAIRIALGAVEPSPVGIEGDGSIALSLASRASALLPGETGVRLCLESTHLLSESNCESGQENKGDLVEHGK